MADVEKVKSNTARWPSKHIIIERPKVKNANTKIKTNPVVR